MDKYIILPTEDKENFVRSYVIKNNINILVEHIVTVDQFIYLEKFPAILFLIHYKSMDQNFFNLAAINIAHGGFNISVSGDIDENIERSISYISLDSINNIEKIVLKTKQLPIRSDKKGKLIVISSLSGGVGKSVIALNLAESLSKFSKKVLLLDLSFNNGTLTHLFQESVYENTSLDSLFESYIKFGSISLEDVEQTIVTRPTFKNLNSELNGDFIFTMQNNINIKKIQNSPQFLIKLINYLTSIYDYVIIDNNNINNFINEFLLVYAKYYVYIFNHINDFIKIKELYSGENVYIIKNNSDFEGDLDKLYTNIFEIPNIEGLKSNFENGKSLFFDSRLLDKVVKEICL